MHLWRVSSYANLDGTGGLYTAGRRHTIGHPVLYTALNPSTALLEILVRLIIELEDRPRCLRILKILVPEAISPQVVDDLPADWSQHPALTQNIGDQWLAEQRSLLLEAPSALVPETWNVLVNPLHAQASLLKIVANYEHPLDERLEWEIFR